MCSVRHAGLSVHALKFDGHRVGVITALEKDYHPPSHNIENDSR